MIQFLRSLFTRVPSWYEEHLKRMWKDTKDG